MSSCCMSLFVLYLVGECPCLHVVCHCFMYSSYLHFTLQAGSKIHSFANVCQKLIGLKVKWLE